MIVRLMFFMSLMLLQVPVLLAAEWVMDPKNSTLNFVATYEGLEAPGKFKQFDVQLRFDPQSPQNSQLNVSVNLAGADMDSDDINAEIVQQEWLSVTQFPKANFKSNNIVKKDGNTYLAHGTLSLKGIGQSITVPFSWNEAENNAGNKSSMQGEFIVKRTIFNIGTGEWSAGNVIGIDIKINFKLELRRAKS
ncbi:MAG: YceI family protein [Woeseiaceae bacterium]